MVKLNFIAILLLVVFCQYTSAQTASSEINLAKINTNLLESLFMKKLNDLRVEQKVSVLTKDAILAGAAQDQASYMRMQKLVTHNQKSKEKENPSKRVEFYKGTHDGIGENCIQIYLKKPTSKKGSKLITTVNTYEEAAQELFVNWKNSAGHYKNMIEKSYDVYGLGFHLSGDSALYAAQVFAQKPYIPIRDEVVKGGNFGVLPTNDRVCACMNKGSAFRTIDDITLHYEGDSIFIKSEKLQELKKFFSNPKDAIYIDIVLRSQFTCENNNLLHGSKVYDGTMLKPVLFSDIFKKNRAKDNKNLYSPFSKIPSYFKKQNYMVNIAYVKDGYSCNYSVTYTPPIWNLDMLTLWPKWIYDEKLQVIPDSFNGKVKLFFPFKRNETTISSEKRTELTKKLEIYEPFIKQVNIKTYSSVEGTEESNLKLQEKRAEELNALLSSITKKDIKVNMEIKENWDYFLKKIKRTPFAFLEGKPKLEIKELLKRKSLLDSMDYLLRDSRVSNIELEIETYINNDSKAELVLAAYQKAVLQQDSLKAFRAQNRLLEAAFKYHFSRPEILDVALPYNKKFLPMWTNYLALQITDIEADYFYNARDTALKAIKIDSTFMPLQFNFCLLALKHLHYFKDTIIPMAQLERKMNQAYKMAKTKNDSALVNHMWLNYSILSAYRHWELHQYDKLNKHLLNIKKYYPQAQITEEEAWRIGLLFNFYTRNSWTLDLILPYLKKGTTREDLVFLYLQTYGFEGNLPKAEWAGYLKKAKSMNSERFNYWIDKIDFQNLRAEEIKKEFCD
jgi:uncharacterized protein YkwD/outer membrane protein OmpA-like peptidoglycan-associated protein